MAHSAKSKPKPCDQKECPFWHLCKYGHDQSRCKHDLSTTFDVVTDIS